MLGLDGQRVLPGLIDAQAIDLEDQIGALAVGKQANFIGLDRDVLEVDVKFLVQTHVLQTYFADSRAGGLQKTKPLKTAPKIILNDTIPTSSTDCKYPV